MVSNIEESNTGSRDDDENIAVSPDGFIGTTEAVECKCLSSARHIEALLTRAIPSEYEYQVLQYFIVNDKLEMLNFVCYDPRFMMFVRPGSRKVSLDYFVIGVKRADAPPSSESLSALRGKGRGERRRGGSAAIAVSPRGRW